MSRLAGGVRSATGILALVAAGAAWAAVLGRRPPPSTPIVLVESEGPAPAGPASLPEVPDPREPVLRLGFAGDLMQHPAQRDDDFAATYAALAPLLGRLDLTVANLEFPIDTTRPVGIEPGTVRFNGSPAHLDAIAAAGFDVLSLANNHAWDAGSDGLARTRAEIEGRGMRVLGAGPGPGPPPPLLLDVRGLRLGLQGYTFAPNAYDRDETGYADFPPPDLPVPTVNFPEYVGRFRSAGRERFLRDAGLARAAGAELLVAFVHWGREWHFGPGPDQRRAARDLLDAGWDLVVGCHGHVLNGASVLDGRLVAWSLGTLVSDFRPLPVRTAAVLEVAVARDVDGRPRVIDFAYRPTLVRGADHAVGPVGPGAPGEEGEAWRLASEILGPAAEPAPEGRSAGGR